MVLSAGEGREIRRDQVATTLSHLGADDLGVEFLNVRNGSDHDELREVLLASISKIRNRHAEQIQTTIHTVDRLIANKANEQVKAVFEAAIRPLRVWFTNNELLPGDAEDVESGLLETEMDGLRYAASLRASVNRRGNWHNFDYWHGLGFGTRRETVARSAEQIKVLKGVIDIALKDEELVEAHDYLAHFQTQVESSTTHFYQEVQTLGEAAFLDQLGDDHAYWNRCYGRWGAGSGYKNDIRRWTGEWFSEAQHRERCQFVENEIQRRWREMLCGLASQLTLEDPAPNSQPDELSAI